MFYGILNELHKCVDLPYTCFRWYISSLLDILYKKKQYFYVLLENTKVSYYLFKQIYKVVKFLIRYLHKVL